MNTNRMEIRLANNSDAECIALLGRITFTETFGHLFRDHNDLLEYYQRTFSVEKIKKGLKTPNNFFWLALVDDLPVGYAKLKLNVKTVFSSSENTCQLQKIYVLRDFQYMKIGLELQNRMLDKAKEKGFEEIWLSVLHTNDRAIGFYKKSGFQNIGNHYFQIGKENFEFMVMSKSLA